MARQGAQLCHEFTSKKKVAEVQDFINHHQEKALPEVSLLLSKQKGLPKDFILNQINGLQKVKSKLPFLLDHSNFIFPPALNLSQASSELTARYKADLIHGDKVIDLSGGLGIDSYFFSRHSKEVDYVERNLELFHLTEQNFNYLGAQNINCHCDDAEHFIANSDSNFDLVYVDPDRRNAQQRFFKIEDCSPKLSKLLPLILQKSRYCLIKLSAMLDISQALTELTNCAEVHVVAVQNEVKELLFLLDATYQQEPEILCVNLLRTDKQIFQFSLSEEKTTSSSFSEMGAFLYEPNTAVLKAGAFKSIAKRFGLKKIAPNTHLYTANQIVDTFPGRTLRVELVSNPKKGLIQSANVVCRNFSMSPEDVRKKFKIQDGDQSSFLYAYKDAQQKKKFAIAHRIDKA